MSRIPDADRWPCVYRIYNAEGVLLYVGSTVCPEFRMRNHASKARWWDVAKDFTFERFDTEEQARAAEVEAIRNEFPRWNIHGRSPFHPDGHAGDYVDVLTNYPDDCRWGMGYSDFVTSVAKRRAS